MDRSTIDPCSPRPPPIDVAFVLDNTSISTVGPVRNLYQVWSRLLNVYVCSSLLLRQYFCKRLALGKHVPKHKILYRYAYPFLDPASHESKGLFEHDLLAILEHLERFLFLENRQC
jgi:hypothetical protein